MHNSATINGPETVEWKNEIGPYSTLPVFMELNVKGNMTDNRDFRRHKEEYRHNIRTGKYF